MLSRKNILSMTLIGIMAFQIPVFADDISDMKANLTDMVTKLIQKYETRIQQLESENNLLKQEILSLKRTPAAVADTAEKNADATPVISPKMTKTDTYNAVIKQANANLGTILSENRLPGYSTIGLFEFMEPNSFFISLDDGNNPAGVTAFKTKILYAFDNNLSFTKVGLFDLDYASQKYRTVFGSNPYAKSVRTRMVNPNYKGKLLDTAASNNTVSVGNTDVKPPVVSGSGGSAPATEVTLAQIKTAYDKTKLLDALKLSDIYIVKNPNDLEVLRIRYRSYYIIGKYDNSLAEIKKIESLQGSAFERTIACDAAVIGKIAKKTDISTYYSTICKKK